ncbi:restriction endonuclease subunit S [Escherichia coli]|uniref:restriction endonuclease subunit S n=1 Tax=Escherichia coli TaxID=562 RepID=UPI00110037B2|nr:restriction endonuclease subunit S [Escherichia coli]EFN8554655.1 restriction endonuclease subunit S [Escherichia coli]EGK3484478.1 restriction endonuclease subunit S [Escherichia coli]EHV2971002.1 restriction endonuclease subunit S [Escherichia coli]EHY3708962.1 restriction endonuclease subunit S [Escherichia coli]EIN4506918.1 restriction endonuclease subunit S [Escherichia coli]
MAGLNKYQAYPEYRDSGMEWLGEIPRTWQTYTGKRLFSSVRTPALSNDEQLAASQKYGVIPQTLMMQLNDSKVMLALKGTDSFRHVEKNNFVISLRSFEGGIEHSNYQGCVSPAYTVLKSVNDISFSFYRYLLKSEPYISALQASTDSLRDGKSINYEQFGAITLPSPSLPEQSIIAHFLDHETAKIDNLIEKQQQLIELLKEKRQAVISHAVTKGLNPDVPMKDSGVEWLGEIPNNWITIKLKFITTLRSEKIVLPHTRYVGLENISSGDGSFIVTTDITPESTSLLFEKDDILFGKLRPYLAKAWLATFSGVCSSEFLVLKVEKLNPKYLNYFILSQTFIKQVDSSTYGTKMPRANWEDIGQLPIPLCSYEESKKIAMYLDKLTANLDILKEQQLHQIELLKERRTALISAAVTGKIDLRNWTAPIPEAETPTEVSA